MAIATAAVTRQRGDVRRLLLRHPELGAAFVVVASWIALVAIAASNHHGAAEGTMPAMPGMNMSSAAPAGSAWSLSGGGYLNWVLMTIAMMGPAALSGIRHTAINSLQWRRRRAMVEYAAAYLAVWTVFGIVALCAVRLAPGIVGTWCLAGALAAAGAWQLTRWKRRWLRDCHRSLPLPPRGWRAEKGALRFGLRNGSACLGSCWCLMVIMVVATGHHLLWMAAITLVVTTERLSERPRRVTRAAAAGLWLAATATLVPIVLGLVPVR